MSFDELPPNSKRRTRTRAASENEAEASSPDAPSAAPKRRPRIKAAETAADISPAQSTDDTTPRPVRSRRKKVVEHAETSPSHVTPEIQPSLTDMSEAVNQAPLAEKRRRAPVKTKSSEINTEASQPTLDTTESVVPSPLSRRNIRNKTKVDSLPPAPAESASETSDHAPIKPKPTVRRRGVKPSVEEITLASPELSEASGSEVSPELSPPERTNRRRRPARKRRPGDTTSEEIPTPTDTPISTEESAESDTETPSSPARSRRRRGGRGKRSELVAVPSEAEVEIPVEPTEFQAAKIEEEHEAKVDRTIGAHLVMRHGCPEIHINGAIYPPVIFFGNLDAEQNRGKVVSEIRRAASAGIHLHSTIIELVCPLSESSGHFDEIVLRLKTVLEADPEGFIIPRIIFVPAKGWKRENPAEVAAYADGTSGDPSITSEKFWQESVLSLTALIDHIQSSEWGSRVFGYHLEKGEWFQPSSQGYDRSPANRDAFRGWLKDKYKHNLVTLRAAWYDGDIQFHTAEIPAQILKPNPSRAFFETRRDRRYIDFHEFTAESTARRIITLARAVKKASHNQAITSVCYGYTFDFGHPYNGHLALGMLLATYVINLICGPPSYRDRKLGGSADFPSPVDSMPLHGKLWLSEDDTKTFLSPAEQDPEDFNPRFSDRISTEYAHDRAIGNAYAHAAGTSWMDLWGDGWLDDDLIWDRIRKFKDRFSSFTAHRERARVPEVVALIDEKSLLHIQHGETFFRNLTNGLRETLHRAGVSYGTYLQNDILAKDFPTEAKLYLFLTPFRLTSEQRSAIKEKLQTSGKTLAWLYAPGACEERPSIGGLMEESSAGVTGFTLRQQAWNSEMGSRIIDSRHALTDRLNSRELGTRERLNPSFYVDDEAAVNLAEYQSSCLTSLAVKELDGWKSVFVGDPVLPLELLRGICRYAGVHLWTPQGDDVASIGNGFVTIHANTDGGRTLHLPDYTALYDMCTERLISDNIREYRYSMKAGATQSFFVGQIEKMQRIGLPNLPPVSFNRRRGAQPELTRSIPPVHDSNRLDEVYPDPFSEDIATLEAVLSVDLSSVNELEFYQLEDDEAFLATINTGTLPPASAEETLAAGEALSSGRRRRRRGGRGRGRNRVPGESAEGAEADNTQSAENESEIFPKDL